MGTMHTKVLSVVAGGVLAATALPAVPAVAQSAIDSVENPGAPSERVDGSLASTVQQASVQGEFSYDQGVVSSNETLRRTIYQASDFLCAGKDNEVSTTTREIGSIRISGDVENEFTTRVADLEKKHPVRKIMGCTCAGNPADGAASANADVEGIKLSGLIADASPKSGVNTITFISDDGYRVSLPYGYVMQRFSILVTSINGEGMQQAVGCANQLWLGSTSARHFAQNVVAIEVTCEQTPPPFPGASRETAPTPNVGIVAGR